MPMKDLLAFTRMTGDLVKAMMACGKPVIAAVDGICVGRGRDHRDGRRPAAGDAGGEMRVPVHPRRACRLRHGGLRHAAPDHRAGPGGGAALHRAHHERRGGAIAGGSGTRCTRPRRWTRRRGPGRASGRRADLRAWDDQDPARSRNGTWGSTRRSRPRRRPRRSACRPAISSGPTGPLSPRKKPVFAGD